MSTPANFDPDPGERTGQGTAIRRGPPLERIRPVAFAFLALIIVFLLYQVVGGALTLIVFRGQVTGENVGAVRWVTMLGEIFLILLPTLVLARLRSRSLVDLLRLRVPAVGEIVLTLIAVFALQQVLQGYQMVQDAIPLPPEIQKVVDTVREIFASTYRLLVSARSVPEFLFVVGVVSLVPAISEELLFRGLVQRSLEDGLGGMRGAVLTGIIFAAYHLNPLNFVALAALGVYFGFIVYRSRSLLVSVSAHFFNNFVACAASFLQLKDDFVAVAPRGEVTPATMFVNVVLFTVVFVLATYYFVRMTERPAPEP